MSFHKYNQNGSLTFVEGDYLGGSLLAGIIQEVCSPIGTIIGWNKNFLPTASLPNGWVECNGQTLSDASSPFNGSVMPNLNGSAGTVQRMLLGSITTGLTGAVGSHTHTGTTNIPDTTTNRGVLGTNAPSSTHTHTFTTNVASSYPPYYCIVYIIRVK